MSKILQYPELKVNPFADRICKAFSSSQDGDCTFEDFLDMMSVFSEGAPKSVKAEHAFRIFGMILILCYELIEHTDTCNCMSNPYFNIDKADKN